MKIAVVGLGYVGLPLAIQFARANVTVDDVNVNVVAAFVGEVAARACKMAGTNKKAGA